MNLNANVIPTVIAVAAAATKNRFANSVFHRLKNYILENVCNFNFLVAQFIYLV